MCSLKTYPDQIGVTYYLVGRLQEFSEPDVAFYWPQLWSVLVHKLSLKHAEQMRQSFACYSTDGQRGFGELLDAEM